MIIWGTKELLRNITFCAGAKRQTSNQDGKLNRILFPPRSSSGSRPYIFRIFSSPNLLTFKQIVILSFEVLHVLSFPSLERTLSIFLATLDAQRNNPRSARSPWQQCNTFGALSGYLIKTGSPCVGRVWTFLLSPGPLSEADTPLPEKKARGTEDGWGGWEGGSGSETGERECGASLVRLLEVLDDAFVLIRL